MEKWKNIDDFGLSEKSKAAMKEDAIVKVKLWDTFFSHGNTVSKITDTGTKFTLDPASEGELTRMALINFVIMYHNLTMKDLGLDAPKAEASPRPKAEKAESKKE